MGYQLVAVDHVQLAMPRGREAEARDFYQDLLGLEERPSPRCSRPGEGVGSPTTG